MHPIGVLRVLLLLLILIGFFLLLPLVVALIYGEHAMILPFLLPAGSLLTLSSLGLSLTRKHKNGNLSTRDGILLAALAWTSAAAFGSLPFLLSGFIPSLTNAFFETMSGFTTTGATILNDIEILPRSLLFWRSLTHWLGGMGIVVLTIAVLPLLGSGGMQLIRAELPGPSVERTGSRIAQTAKILWGIYLSLTVLEVLLLWLCGLDLFDALVHTFGTMATGGFSAWNTSIAHFRSPAVEIVITVFMLLAGTNFIIFYRLFMGRFRDIGRNTEWKAYLIVFLSAVLIAGLSLWTAGGRSAGEALRAAAFQCASILTTTGYATKDYTLWPPLAQAVLFLLMFVGGCSGSTGGGIKVIRVFILLKLAFHEINYRLHPRAVFSLNIGNNRPGKSVIYPIAGFTALYLSLLLGVTLWVSSSGQDLTTSLSTALATLGNIGPGFGRIGPALNYAFFPDRIKWVLSFAMMAGRLELYTLLILFTTRFWKD